MSLSISARPRTARGRHLGALRREGIVPAVVYGPQQQATAIQADERDLQRLYQRAGRSTLIDLAIEGDRPRKVLIRDFQVHPRSGRPLHADFFAVNLAEKTQAEIPVLVSGESPAVAAKLGLVLQALSVLRVEALPADLPGHLSADVSVLTAADSTITAGDIELPAGVTLLTDPGDVVAKISGRRVRAGGEGGEDEEGAEAEAEEGAEPSAESDGDTPEA